MSDNNKEPEEIETMAVETSVAGAAAAMAETTTNKEEEEKGHNDGTDGTEEANHEPTTATKQQQAEQQQPEQQQQQHRPQQKKRRIIVGQKADLYSHFETLNERAYTKGGKDLGLYLCICNYCKAAYETSKHNWEQLSDEERNSREAERPFPPTPFPRTRRYCINHQKQCPHVPTDTIVAAMQGGTTTQSADSKTRSRSSITSMSGINSNAAAAAAGGTHIPVNGSTVHKNAATTATTTTGIPPLHNFIPQSTFEVYVAKDTFKFNAAHFVAFPGFRERLHGHNYAISVRLQGSQSYIGADGYVLDFGDIKKVCKEVCKELNEFFLCPIYSDVLKVTHLKDDENMIRLDCSVDDTYFLMPREDVKLLPIVHATAEELAIYLWSRVMERLDATFLRARGIQYMELTVAEAPGQQASFRYPVQSQTLDVRSFLQSGLPIVPEPCLPNASKTKAPRTAVTTAASSSSLPTNGKSITRKPTLESFLSLTTAMKAHGLLTRDVTADELSRLMKTVEK